MQAWDNSPILYPSLSYYNYVGAEQMQPYNLQIQLERLQHSKGLVYRATLAGLLAMYGRDAIVKALVESRSGNVVSMAASPNWCRPHLGPRLGPTRAA
jgi:hypothetical protein